MSINIEEMQVTCTKVENVLVKSRIVIDYEPTIYHYMVKMCQKPDESQWQCQERILAEAKEKWAKEFEEFVRDHRSQDPVSITVEREYEDRCSACYEKWEDYADGDSIRCANCGALVESKEATCPK